MINPVEDTAKACSHSPALQAAVAAIETVENPSIANLLMDIELAVSIVGELKKRLKGVHPSVVNLIKAMF